MRRAASVPPGVYRNAAHVSSGSRLPSYCCPQGQYFGFGGTSSAGQSAMPRASRAMYSSSAALSSRPSSVGVISRGSLPATYSRVTGSHYLDALPTRHFGSRLSRGYSSVASRPEIYEQAYGVSYLPSMGRDGCSSYTLAGATIDDSDDLVNTSYKRDNEVLRSVERQMMPIHEHQRLQSKVQRLGLLAKHGEPYHQAMISMPSSSRPSGHLPPKHNRVVSGLDLVPISYEPTTYAVRMAGKIQGNADWSVPRVLRNVLPSGTARILKAKAMAKVDQANVYNAPPMVQQRSRVVRASSVPPQYSRAQPAQASRFRRTVGTRRPGGASVTVTARGSADNDVYYRVPQPAVIYKHETVNRGSDLLTMKERQFARQSYDLASPTGTLGLKMRLHELQNGLTKHGAMLGKYLTGPDADDIEIQAELRRIKTNREFRAKSVA